MPDVSDAPTLKGELCYQIGSQDGYSEISE